MDNCWVCRQPVEQKQGGHRKRRYCSDACRQRERRRRQVAPVDGLQHQREVIDGGSLDRRRKRFTPETRDLLEEVRLATNGRVYRRIVDALETEIYRALKRELRNLKRGASPAQVRALENEVQRLQERLNIEERFRTDTQVHHFKKWIRSHDHPQDTDFFKRFLADSQLPEHASRGLYEAKMRSVGNYSREDIHLFQDAWKTMLFTQ